MWDLVIPRRSDENDLSRSCPIELNERPRNIIYLLIFGCRTKVIHTVSIDTYVSRLDHFYYSTNRVLRQVYQYHILGSFFQIRYGDSVHEYLMRDIPQVGFLNVTSRYDSSSHVIVSVRCINWIDYRSRTRKRYPELIGLWMRQLQERKGKERKIYNQLHSFQK